MLSLAIFLSNAMTSDFVGNPCRILDREPARRYFGNLVRWREANSRWPEPPETLRKKRAKAIN